MSCQRWLRGICTSLLLCLMLLTGCGSTNSTTGEATSNNPVPPVPATASPTFAIPILGDPLAVTVSDTVATDLRAPWGLVFLPEGGALVSLRDSGTIVRVPPHGPVTTEGTVPRVVADSEGGLLGLALHPEFGSNGLLYAYLTATSDNRVVRMRYDPNQPEGSRLGKPEVVLAGIPNHSFHNGGRIAFGPDSMLYVATGDARQGSLAQQPDSLAGKILRLTPEGKPAPENPFGTAVYSLGHRNVQGLGWDSRDRLWASEFGENTWDELNLITPGANYGWPLREGKQAGPAPLGSSRSEGLTEPVAQFPPSENSPSGLTIVGDVIYLSGLRGQRLWQIPLDSSGRSGVPRDFFAGQFGRLRTVAAAPDGSLWLVTNNTDGRGSPRDGDDRILRLRLGGQ